MNSKLEDGWLGMKLGKSRTWERYWVVYDNDIIMYSKVQHSHEPNTIAMNKVRTLRADVSERTEGGDYLLCYLSFFRLWFLIVSSLLFSLVRTD
jgi:hypothetical protein